MKLTIENKHKVLGRVVKNDIVMLLPEMIHKGETYVFKAKDDRNRDYRWELTRHQMIGGRYEMRFWDSNNHQQITKVEKHAMGNLDNFLYICASMMPY